MRKLLNLLLIVVLLTTFLFVNTSPAVACSCAGGEPLINHISSSDAIFAGKVIDQNEFKTRDRFGTTLTLYTLEVSQIWKGESLATITVATDLSICGANLDMGQDYLVFASKEADQLYTSLCDRNQTLSTATKDIVALDQLFGYPLPFSTSPAASITILEHTIRYEAADQLSVRFVIANSAKMAEASDGLRQQLIDALIAHGVNAKMMEASFLYTDGAWFYLVIERNDLSEHYFTADLRHFSDTQKALEDDTNLPIIKVEVKFSIADATRIMANAQKGALYNARIRAASLAALMGAKTAKIIAISDMTTEGVPYQSTYGQVETPWYSLPLTKTQFDVTYVGVPVSLTVTFALEEAVTVRKETAQTRNSQVTPIAQPAFISPLATPKS